MKPLNLTLVATLLAVALVSLSVRWKHDSRMERLPEQWEQSGWFSADADGLYHARRVQRGLADGELSSFDPKMNSPHGAIIPWPPYYDQFLTLLSKFTGVDASDKRSVEHFVSMLPFYFGVLTSILVGLLAFAASRRWEACLLAGMMHSLAYGSVHTSAPGIGDHHAFIAFLSMGLWGWVSHSLGSGLSQVRNSAWRGAGAGVLAGVLLGSWVASLVVILLVQLILAWQFFKPNQAKGLPAFSCAFHLTAFMVLLPAVASSPWQELKPWILVNLSWFHPFYLLLGAGVSVMRRPLRGAFVCGLGLLGMTLLGWGPGAGVQEAFAWVSRGNEFMAGIAESKPLWKADTTSTGGMLRWLGISVVFVPFAWWGLRKSTSPAFHAWLVVVPVVILQALAQRRFADLAVGPIAVLVAVWLMQWRTSVWAKPGVVLLLGLCAWISVDWQGPWTQSTRQGATRDAMDWISNQGETKSACVLAPWDLGHGLEWAGGAQTVATNFGTYVGEDSFRDPARFYLMTSEIEAEELLKNRQVDYVLRESRLPLLVKDLAKAAGGAPWNNMDETMLERLGNPADAPAFLRLATLSPWMDEDERLPSAVPYYLIWEYTGGYAMELQGAPGKRVQVSLDYHLDRGEKRIYEWTWSAWSGITDDTGKVQLRMPSHPDFADEIRFIWK